MSDKGSDIEKYLDGQFSPSSMSGDTKRDPEYYKRATQRLRDRKRKGPDNRIDIPEADQENK